MTDEERLQREKQEALEAARYYDKEIKERIRNAKTVGEIDRALREGRHRL